MNLKKGYSAWPTQDLGASEAWCIRLLGRAPYHRPRHTLARWEVFQHGV